MKRVDWRTGMDRLLGRADDLADRTRGRWRKLRSASGPLIVLPYMGYGTSERLQLSGRVLRDENFAEPLAEATTFRNLVEFYKRLESDEVPGARVRAQYRDTSVDAVADEEGYFRIELPLAQPLDSGWHDVALELLEHTSAPVRATGEVLVPSAQAKFGVISDIDDTVLWTDVRRRLRMLLMLMRSNAHTRKPFKGVAAFYRALVRGASGDEGNPLFYVSSSPWNLYVPLTEFLAVQGIPRGPLLLKDYGDHIVFGSGDHRSHKSASIEAILIAYPHLPFILIGDSGEQDPEIYGDIVRRHPGRIRAVYIRNVDPDPSRIEAIDKLIASVRDAGTQLVLAADSEHAAMHAAAEGFIAQDAVGEVRADKRVEERTTITGEPV